MAVPGMLLAYGIALRLGPGLRRRRARRRAGPDEHAQARGAATGRVCRRAPRARPGRSRAARRGRLLEPADGAEHLRPRHPLRPVADPGARHHPRDDGGRGARSSPSWSGCSADRGPTRRRPLPGWRSPPAYLEPVVAHQRYSDRPGARDRVHGSADRPFVADKGSWTAMIHRALRGASSASSRRSCMAARGPPPALPDAARGSGPRGVPSRPKSSFTVVTSFVVLAERDRRRDRAPGPTAPSVSDLTQLRQPGLADQGAVQRREAGAAARAATSSSTTTPR